MSQSKNKGKKNQQSHQASNDDVKVVDVDQKVSSDHAAEDMHSAHLNSEKKSHHHDSPADSENEKPKVAIHFPGSELVRAKFPKSFDVAEAVATDWVHGGEFKELPIDQPLVQYVTQKGLQQAKEIEKKVLESPVTEKVAMQVFTVGLKAQGLISQFRSRFKKD